jgi:hypothetical protein
VGAKQGSSGSRGRPSAGGRTAVQQQRATSRALATARGGRAAGRRLWMTVGPVALVLVLITVLVAVKVTSSSATSSGVAAGAAPASVTNAVAGVPAATLNTVGVGTAGQKPFTSLPTKTSGAALTSGGLPRVLYVGAEYCPYCAAERWSVAVALSRFGTLNNVGTTASSPSDVYPNTATLSFHRTTYSSKVVAFNGYELFSNQAQGSGYAPLDTLSSADNALFQSAGGSFPFVDIGGRYIISGASFSPQLLAGMSANQIAAALSDPNSTVAKAIDGTANVITAAICATTGQQPTAVCTSPGVVAGQAKLGG